MTLLPLHATNGVPMNRLSSDNGIILNPLGYHLTGGDACHHPLSLWDSQFHQRWIPQHLFPTIQTPPGSPVSARPPVSRQSETSRSISKHSLLNSLGGISPINFNNPPACTLRVQAFRAATDDPCQSTGYDWDLVANLSKYLVLDRTVISVTPYMTVHTSPVCSHNIDTALRAVLSGRNPHVLWLKQPQGRSSLPHPTLSHRKHRQDHTGIFRLPPGALCWSHRHSRPDHDPIHHGLPFQLVPLRQQCQLFSVQQPRDQFERHARGCQHFHR